MTAYVSIDRDTGQIVFAHSYISGAFYDSKGVKHLVDDTQVYRIDAIASGKLNISRMNVVSSVDKTI